MKTKKEMIDGLVANEATRYTEDDRAWLGELAEEQLQRMEPQEVEPRVETKPMTNEEVVAKAKELGLVEKPADAGDDDDPKPVLNEEEREALDYGKRALRERRAGLTEHITANTENVWSAEELAAMPLEALEKIGKAVKAPVANYGGRPGPTERDPARDDWKPEPYEPPVVNFDDRN